MGFGRAALVEPLYRAAPFVSLVNQILSLCEIPLDRLQLTIGSSRSCTTISLPHSLVECSTERGVPRQKSDLLKEIKTSFQ